ncbi:MAG: hypothetical protein AB1757_13450 [Acidobacteriota bacterium]
MKKKTFLLTHLTIAIGFVTLTAFYPQPGNASNAVATSAAKETYTGNLIYFGGTRGTTTAIFTLTVDSYTPDSEVVGITGALKDGGQDALLKALRKQKRGTLQINSGIGLDINAIWMTTDAEGERQITALAERWIGVFEARRGSRSLDYPFTYIELFIDTKGKGDGGLIPAAKVRYLGEKTIEVENFGIYPARLTNVKLKS